VKHNVYFDGQVQSLGFDLPSGRATVGVISAGTYTFTTDAPEQVLILSGTLQVRLPGERWRAIAAPGAYVVPARTTFDVSATHDVSYLCRFEAAPV
jgi:purine/pyrimidine-nucleoside phosphorylase